MKNAVWIVILFVLSSILFSMVAEDSGEPKINFIKGNLRNINHKWILNEKYELKLPFSTEVLRDNKIKIVEANDVLVSGIIYDTQILVYSLKINNKLYQILDKDGKSRIKIEIKNK